MKNIIFCCLCILYTFVAYTQQHDNNWVFGVAPNQNNPLSFLSGANMISFSENNLKLQGLNAPYSCAYNCHTISDSTGTILFSFNGVNIYDRNFHIMENGDKVNLWATQGFYQLGDRNMLVLPLGDGLYQIIHQMRKNYLPNMQLTVSDTVFYSIIDMTKNGGLGRVLQKNKILSVGKFATPLVVTKHANGRDWWVFFFDRIQNKVHRFSTTTSGFPSQIETQEQIGFLGNGEYEGYVDISIAPNGKKIVLYNQEYGFAIWDIDRCDGTLYNQELIEQEDKFASIGIFSPNSRYYYLFRKISWNAQYNEVFQIDMNNPSLNWELITVAHEIQEPGWNTHVYYGALGLAPNGKIYQNGGYINRSDSINGGYLFHSFEFPNRKGKACNYMEGVNGLKLPRFLPTQNTPYYPNYRLGPIDGSSCDTLGLDNHPLAHWRWDIEDSLQALQLTFTDLSAYEPSTWSWDFGDPASGLANISSDTSPVHIFSAPGIYQVCQTVCNANSCDTACKEVVLGVSSAEEAFVASEQAFFALYPNPVQTFLTIEAKEFLVPYSFDLYDMLGRRIFSKNKAVSSAAWTLGMENVPSGLYFYKISDEMGRVLQYGTVVRAKRL